MLKRFDKLVSTRKGWFATLGILIGMCFIIAPLRSLILFSISTSIFHFIERKESE